MSSAGSARRIPALQLLQAVRRLYRQILDQAAANRPVRGEGIGLTSGPEQREHELCPEPLLQGMSSEQHTQLTDEVAVLAKGKPSVEIGLVRSQPAFLEADEVRRILAGDRYILQGAAPP